MKQTNKTHEYCKNCNNPLTGIQEKFCSYVCGDMFRAARTQELDGLEVLENIKQQNNYYE